MIHLQACLISLHRPHLS